MQHSSPFPHVEGKPGNRLADALHARGGEIEPRAVLLDRNASGLRAARLERLFQGVQLSTGPLPSLRVQLVAATAGPADQRLERQLGGTMCLLVHGPGGVFVRVWTDDFGAVFATENYALRA